MNTKEILSIVALAALGLCLLCCLAKAAMKKGDKSRKHCDKACGAFVFVAIVLMAVSQLLGEREKYMGCQLMGTHGNGLCHDGNVGGNCGSGTDIKCGVFGADSECATCPSKYCKENTCCKYIGPDKDGKDIYKQQVLDNAGNVAGPKGQKQWVDNCN